MKANNEVTNLNVTNMDDEMLSIAEEALQRSREAIQTERTRRTLCASVEELREALARLGRFLNAPGVVHPNHIHALENYVYRADDMAAKISAFMDHIDEEALNDEG